MIVHTNGSLSFVQRSKQFGARWEWMDCDVAELEMTSTHPAMENRPHFVPLERVWSNFVAVKPNKYQYFFFKGQV